MLFTMLRSLLILSCLVGYGSDHATRSRGEVTFIIQYQQASTSTPGQIVQDGNVCQVFTASTNSHRESNQSISCSYHVFLDEHLSASYSYFDI